MRPTQTGAQVVLSEFCAANLLTLRDDDGSAEDWIELNNVSSQPVNLDGWRLTDELTQPDKWVLPSTNIAPGGFLLIFASGKDRRAPGRALHTNFKLTASGEYLALLKSDGKVATSYAPAYPPQAEDVSYGSPPGTLQSTLVGAGTEAQFLIPRDDSLGSTWTAKEFDGSQWPKVKLGIGFDLNNTLVQVPVADSVKDWSTNGVQGEKGWFYGYYNRGADNVPGYQASDFLPFPRSGNPYGSANFWTGTQYLWPSTIGPWDVLGQTAVHPNGSNSGAEHWVIRRWQSTVAGILQVEWTLNKTDPTGLGVTGKIFQNGEQKDAGVVSGADTTGIKRVVSLPDVHKGDFIDLAVTPIGVGGDQADTGDSAAETLKLSLLSSMTNLATTQVDGSMHGSNATAYVRIPFVLDDPTKLNELKFSIRYNDGFNAYLNGVLIAAQNAPVQVLGGTQADSIADWSYSGQQGQNNWYDGYYDRGADPDQIYDPYNDFVSDSKDWTWNGGAWVLGPGNPPWDMITAGTWQPNGTNSGNVHWTIRRWISQTTGPATCRISFAKENETCGSGTTLHVLQGGVERFTWTLAYNDTAGLQTNLFLPNLQPGDFVDFALDPLGTDGSPNDLCDTCKFSVVVEQSASSGPVWNSTATAIRSPEETALPWEKDLTRYIDLLTAGTNVLAIQGMNSSPDDPNFLVAPELTGTFYAADDGQRAYFKPPTPGAVNGPGTLTLGPVVDEISHTPVVPRDAEDLVVRARISPTLHTVKSAILKYRVMYSAEVAVPMYDDGAHDDGAAGDGIFAARIPASSSLPGQMVRYYITAADSLGQETRAPSYQSVTRSPQYLGTVVYDPGLTNSLLPVLHWFIQNPSLADSDTTARCSMFYNGEFYDNIGADLHGQSTRAFPKKSYDLDFNPGYGFRWSDKERRVGALNLLTTWADKSHMRNVLAHETYRDGGAPSHFAFAVRVQRNAAFFSVANVVENGGEDFLIRLGLDPKGALYKMYNSAESTSGAEKKTRKQEGTADLQALITGMQQPTSAAQQAYLFDNLNVPEFIDFLAAMIITANTDCCHKNYYFYRDSEGTGEWQAMPWDVDLSFGRVWTCGSPCLAYFDERIYTNQGITVGSGNIVMSPIYGTPSTRQMFMRRLRSLMDQLMQPPGTPPINDFYRLKTQRLRDQIAPDATLDLAKWGTWGTRETITQAVNRIWTEFLPPRRTFLYAQPEIPSPQPTNVTVNFSGLEFRSLNGNPLEEWLSLTNGNAFAVDISGWKLSGGVRFTFRPGTVMPSRSVLYVSPDVKAFRGRTVSPKGGERRFVVGPYSGDLSTWGETLSLFDAAGRLVSTNSYTGVPSDVQRYLRVTEISYNPDAWPGATALDPQQFEFIELRNTGPLTLDLRGVKFTQGITFDFSAGNILSLAPGARVLLVRNAAAFALRYGSGLPVAGEYVGALNNNGEQLRLEDSIGEKILDFAYDNKWYPITDGHGYSLSIVDETQPWSNWSLKENWRPNGTLGGTPGTADTILIPPGEVVINEVLAHTDPPLSDTIELLNPAHTNVNIGNWFLTDDFSIPRKYRVPYPTIMGAGGYLCFAEAQFNQAGSPSSFVLNSEGDDVWLFSADSAGKLTGYVQGFAFGATANGVSLGRYTNSLGDVDYPAQKALTLGGQNLGPLVGPIVISEIMYHPPNTQTITPASYIEFANTASTNVPLYHPSEVTNTWRLRNAVDFDFPQNVQLPPGGRLLIVGFDPITDAVNLNEFRTLYAIGPDVPIYGPWLGGLGNAGETLELKKPDQSGTNGVPYVLVDKVSYSQTSPWPSGADGGGASLQRIALSAYGNDPTNWFAADPTPGSPNREPNHLAISQSVNGYLVRFSGTAGLSCEVQRSTDLSSWTTLVRQQVPASGTVEYEDKSPPAAGSYYRAVQR